mgnify:CR=1 FL=1
MDALVNLQCGVKNRHIRAENGDMLLDSLGPGGIIQGNTLGENNAANITQGATASVLIFPMTVTHTLSSGALLMAILSRSQQKSPEMLRSVPSPTLIVLNKPLSINSLMVMVLFLLGFSI